MWRRFRRVGRPWRGRCGDGRERGGRPCRRLHAARLSAGDRWKRRPLGHPWRAGLRGGRWGRGSRKLDAAFALSRLCRPRQIQARQHEKHCCANGNFSHWSRRAPRSEYRPRSSTERRPHIRPFTGLQQHDNNKGQTNGNMNYINHRCHDSPFTSLILAPSIMAANSSALRLAPPTRQPSMSGMASSSFALDALTLPPY